MKRSNLYVTCEICGKQHNSKSVNVKYNYDKLQYECIKCNIVTVVFTVSQLERLLQKMKEINKSAMVYNGHVSQKQFNISRTSL